MKNLAALKNILILPAIMFGTITAFMPLAGSLMYKHLLVFFELEKENSAGLGITSFLLSIGGMALFGYLGFECLDKAFPSAFLTEDEKKKKGLV